MFSTSPPPSVGSIVRYASMLLAGIVFFACTERTDRATGPLGSPSLSVQGQDPVAAAMAIQNRHTDELLAIPGVVGTATGLGADGRPAVLVLARAAGVSGIPASLDGARVEVRVTGDVAAFTAPGTPARARPGGGVTSSALIGLYRPVPNGVSSADVYPSSTPVCLSGTLGAAVTTGTTTQYALSNNHVYASQNKAPAGTPISQPGLVDTSPQCSFNATDQIGTLFAFVPIVFSRFASNQVDAALAVASTSLTCSSPSGVGYGSPSTTTVSAAIGMPIEKVGRTTGVTTGSVTMINVTVLVSYGPGKFARFVNQFATTSGFSGAGDSGSLIVENDGTYEPVGLLFAGTSDGTTFANPIAAVFSELGTAAGGTTISVCHV